MSYNHLYLRFLLFFFSASDFVDESGLYSSPLTTTSVPNRPQKTKAESSRFPESQDHVTTEDKVAQQEQINNEELEFILQPVTPKRGLRKPITPQQPAADDVLTSTDLQALSEIFDNSPLVPNYDNFNDFAQTLIKPQPQKHNQAEGHHNIIEPNNAASILISENEQNGETGDQLIVSSPGMDAPPELEDDKTLTNGTDEYNYEATGDAININIVINREPSPCYTSALFGVSKIDANSRVPGSVENVNSSNKNKTKTCEMLLSRERNLSEAIRSSYQECVLKVNVVENDLLDSKKEGRVRNALLKETLAMINYLNINATKKMILKSSIVLIDYKQILREVIHVLLDIKPTQYNIVKSELEGDTIVKFEVSAYNEKLLLFLNGRIKLPGTNFELIDYDAPKTY